MNSSSSSSSSESSSQMNLESACLRRESTLRSSCLRYFLRFDDLGIMMITTPLSNQCCVGGKRKTTFELFEIFLALRYERKTY